MGGCGGYAKTIISPNTLFGDIIIVTRTRCVSQILTSTTMGTKWKIIAMNMWAHGMIISGLSTPDDIYYDNDETLKSSRYWSREIDTCILRKSNHSYFEIIVCGTITS